MNEWIETDHVTRYLNRADRIPHRKEGERVLLEHLPEDIASLSLYISSISVGETILRIELDGLIGSAVLKRLINADRRGKQHAVTMQTGGHDLGLSGVGG